MLIDYRRFSIEPTLRSKTDEHISLRAKVTRSDNSDTGGQAETTPAPVAKAPQLADGHTQAQQDVIDEAWKISNGDMRFIYLLTAENGQYTYKRVHPKVAGTIGVDLGLCGINNYYHSDITSNPLFLTNWKWQLNKCYELYKGGTTFYGIKRYDRDPAYHQKITNKFK